MARDYYGRKTYGLFALFVDFVLLILTGGLWLIWIIARYFRSRTVR